VLRLFDKPEERRDLGAAATAYVNANHRWEACLEPLGRAFGLSPKVISVPKPKGTTQRASTREAT